ncbi:IS110 family transposase [Streptomyces sp. YIM 121038]|uniref:IS110 family transposase n=1 Tax=Streptomyces sp. YIM 121038 TaxID=2136401 RepID=UPI0020179866|nr:IS110 family transposase [Streptomyces sp. YIM 121038]
MPRLQDVKDEVIHLRSAGVDLGKRFLPACVRVPSTKRAGSWSLETERFGTTTAEVRRLLAWLLERRAEVVVMEATSDCWRGVYYLLQPHLNLMLVNPAHLKGIRGRKSDPGDAAFLARAGASGMVMASFVPAVTSGNCVISPAAAPSWSGQQAGRPSGWRRNSRTPA